MQIIQKHFCLIAWSFQSHHRDSVSHQLRYWNVSTVWPLRDVVAIFNQSFSNCYQRCIPWAFPVTLPWGEFHKLSLIMSQHRQATSHYLRKCWPKSLPTYGVPRSQWFNACLGAQGDTGILSPVKQGHGSPGHYVFCTCRVLRPMPFKQQYSHVLSLNRVGNALPRLYWQDPIIQIL